LIITFVSILVPFVYFVFDDHPPSGKKGGFLNALGMGLGFFLLVYGIITHTFCL